MQSSFSYNAWLQLATLAYANGQIQQITNGLDSLKTETYTYDDLGRLLTAQRGPDANIQRKYSYDYDRYGNRWGQNVVAGSGYNGQLSFDTVSNNNRVNSTGFSFDLSGNLSANGPAASFTYNPENFMTAAGATTYQYDAQGRRVRKTVGSTVTDYFYSGSEVIAEKQGANWTDYIFFGLQRIAKQTGTTASTASYLHADHLRSTRVCTDANGNATGTCDYEPFGEIQQGSPCSVPTNYRFAGMEWDADAGPNGLYHTWFRQYDVNQGRWMSVDPLPGSPEDPQSLNRYAYVRNDPVDFIDPLGLRCVVWWNFTWVPEKKSEDPAKEIPGHWELTSVDSWCFADPGGERRCRGPECREPRDPRPPPISPTAREKFDKCLNGVSRTLSVADTVGFYGLASSLINLGSSAAIATYEQIQRRTAGNLAQAIARQVPTPTANGILGGLREGALFRQGTAATIGKLSLYVSAAATAVSVGIRLECARRSGYWGWLPGR